VGRVKTVVTNPCSDSRYWLWPGRIFQIAMLIPHLLTRSWATDLSTAKYWTDPEKSHLFSPT